MLTDLEHFEFTTIAELIFALNWWGKKLVFGFAENKLRKCALAASPVSPLCWTFEKLLFLTMTRLLLTFLTAMETDTVVHAECRRSGVAPAFLPGCVHGSLASSEFALRVVSVSTVCHFYLLVWFMVLSSSITSSPRPPHAPPSAPATLWHDRPWHVWRCFYFLNPTPNTFSEIFAWCYHSTIY